MKRNDFNTLEDIPDLLLLGNIDGVEISLTLTADQARVLKRACAHHKKDLATLITDLAQASMRR